MSAVSSLPSRAVARVRRAMSAALGQLRRGWPAVGSKADGAHAADPELRFHVERFSVLPGPFGRNAIMEIRGWGFRVTQPESLVLEVRADDSAVCTISCNRARPDVARRAAGLAQSEEIATYSGFEVTAYLPAGASRVELVTCDSGVVIASSIVNGAHHTEDATSRTGNAVSVGTATVSAGRALVRRIARRARHGVQPRDLLSLARWRHWLRRVAQEIRSLRVESGPDGARGVSSVEPYAAYVQQNALTPRTRALLETAHTGFAFLPVISIVMPVYNVEPRWLKAAIESVTGQIYPHWQLCIADDASSRDDTRAVLRELAGDDRIRVVFRAENGHICRATNTAAEQATGDFVAFMDQDDVLEPHALFEIARLLQDHPDADLVYSDEDKISVEGERYDAHFKPDWSPVLLLGYNYINHLTCVRRSLFVSVGGLRVGYEGAQDYDLLLRLARHTDRVHHIAKVLYHWRAIPESTASSARVKPMVATAARAALEDFLAAGKRSARPYQPSWAEAHGLPVYQLDGPDEGPRVDIIIPTKDRLPLLRRCIDSIVGYTAYRNYRIMVVDNASVEPDTIAYLGDLQTRGIRVERVENPDGGFSFSHVVNEGVQRSDAELILLLNNDTEVRDRRWLSRMVCYLGLGGVGAVGARLLYPDGTIQHAGVVLATGKDGAPGHAFAGTPGAQLSYFFLAETARECAAVTAACLLTPRRLYLEAGGFDHARFGVSLNDVDYCQRLRALDMRVVYAPGAELMHHEGATRPAEDSPHELAGFKALHGDANDPYYNPSLLADASFHVRPSSMLDYAAYLNRPLKVLFYSHNLNLEGAPKVVISLAKGLHARGAVHPVVVSAADGPARAELEAAGVECRVLPAQGTGNILQGWASAEDFEATLSGVADLLRDLAPDVVVANVVNSFFVVEAAHQTDIPAVWIIHESYDRAALARHVDAFAMPRCEAAFQHAAHVVFVSRETSEMYRRYDSRRHFRVIHNGLSHEWLRRIDEAGGRERARHALGLGGGGIRVIVSVGTVCDRKDQETLVRGFALLARKRQDFRAYLVGARAGDPYNDYIGTLIRTLELGAIVELVPETSAVDIYLHAADVFAFASVNESYSYTILEAMAFGLPIVTTPCQGVAEQVRFGVNALVFPFGDARKLKDHLDTLLSDDNARRRMGENSRDMIAYMPDYDDMVEQYERLLFEAWQCHPSAAVSVQAGGDSSAIPDKAGRSGVRWRAH